MWLVVMYLMREGAKTPSFFIQFEINGVFSLSLAKQVKAVAFQIIDPSNAQPKSL